MSVVVHLWYYQTAITIMVAVHYLLRRSPSAAAAAYVFVGWIAVAYHSLVDLALRAMHQ